MPGDLKGTPKRQTLTAPDPVRHDAAALAAVEDHYGSQVDVQLVESVPGKLKVRLVVPSKDKIRQNVSDLRLKQLMDHGHCQRTVTQELSKQLRANGFLLPKYGVSVNVRKQRYSDVMATIEAERKEIE